VADTSISRTGSAQKQASLWGRGARAYAEVMEDLAREFYAEVFQQLDVGPGTTLLDVGCGSGVAAAVAVERGAQVSGLDATPELLAFARERVPDADFQEGEMEQLPYPDDTFDVVTGFNAFQYAADPNNALVEARRVTRPGGAVMIATLGRPEHTDLATILRVVGTFVPPPPPGAPGPFALSEDGALAALVRKAGLQPRHGGRFVNRWELPADLDITLGALLSGGPITPIIQQVGPEPLQAAIAEVLPGFRTSTGSYVLENEFVYLIARA